MVKLAAPDVLEIFVNAPLGVCMERDPKGMYREAKAGARPRFTGVGDTYEPPESPDLELKTDCISQQEAASAVLQLLIIHGILV
jgi:adenylylsulfate kinase-like enzyme